ncbi:MAG: hypothetical protein ACKOW9_02235 [Candidatus Paceibacterota bacterium]
MSTSYNGSREVFRCDGDVIDWLKIVNVTGDGYFDEWVREASNMVSRGLTPFGSHVKFGSSAGVEITWREKGWWGSEDLIEELHLTRGTNRFEPLVLLGRVYNGDEERYYPGLQWYPVEHQCGGMSCNHFKFIGTPVRLSDSGARKANALSNFCEFDEGHACVGIGGVRLEEIVRYSDLLNEVGLKADRSWDVLTEGVSPIDMREECLEALGDVVGLDTDLYEVSHYSKNSFGLSDSSGWCIVVLYENCD